MSRTIDGPARPLSPFLIYRWGVTNSLSILHRGTGVFLSLGLVVLSCWLIAIATGSDAFAGVMRWYGSAWFKLPLAAWVFCFFYHLANGVRHLAWDAGFGFGRGTIKVTGFAVVLFALAATSVYVAFGMF